MRHPAQRAIALFVSKGGQDSQAMHRHLRECSRCAAEAGSLRRLLQSAGALPAPELPADLRERVSASRAAGSRIILPVADRSSTPRAFRAGVRIAAAIAVLLFVARLVTTRPETGARTDDTITLGLWPGLASAQTAPTTAGARRLPPLIGLRGDRLQPVVATYELRVQRAGVELTAPERARLVIAPDSSDGRAAWRIESGWLGHPTDLQERSFIDRATLAPLRRHALNVGHSRFTVDQRFTGDSVLGTMTTAQRGSAIAAALPRNHGPFLLGEAALVVLLRGLALRRGLEGSFALVGWAGVPSDVYYPVNLAVTGEDRVTIGRRPWDAWRVVVRIGSGRLTVWARKQDGAALRLRETIGDRDYDVTLVSEEVAR